MTKEIPHSVAIFAFLGMVHYTIKWYHRDGAVGLDRLADIFVEIFTRGVFEVGNTRINRPTARTEPKKISRKGAETRSLKNGTHSHV